MNPPRKDSLEGSIFIVGTGRSGTTIVFRMLASHPELGWFSNYSNRFPKAPQVAVFSRLFGRYCHGGERHGVKVLLPVPKEAVEVPRVVTDGWFSQPRIIAPGETPREIVDQYRRNILATLRWQGKSRFLHKHTGFARAAFLLELDASGKFINVVRDGRAVVDSLLRVDWWSGSLDSWWWGDFPPDYAERFHASGEDPAVLAALVWLRLTELIEEELGQLPNGVACSIRYDEFVRSPNETMETICRFANLDMNAKFYDHLSRFRLRNGDAGWQRRLTPKQIQAVEEILGDRLESYGFVE